MPQNLILIPVLAQMLLTFAILGLLPLARRASMIERRQNLQDMATADKADWNVQAQKVAASYASQFELPVLFYVICLSALITRYVDLWLFGLACMFVLLRAVHAAIHIGPNVVKWRFAAFVAGLCALGGMWARFGYWILAAGF